MNEKQGRPEKYSALNPQFREVQEKVLETIEVGEVEEVLPNHLIDFFNMYKDEEKNHVWGRALIDGRSEALLYSQQNGIVAIMVVAPDVDNPRDKFIREHYFVDTTTGKAWDVFQLLRVNPPVSDEHYSSNKTTKIMLANHYPAFDATKDGGIVSIPFNYGNTNVLNQLPFRPTQDQIDFLSRLSVIHEFGHRFQFYLDSSDSAPGLWGRIFVKLFHSSSKKGLRSIFKVPFLARSLAREKEHQIIVERNANAFALAVVRKLKQEGIDLTRLLELRELIQVFDASLKSHEAYFADFGNEHFSKIDQNFFAKSDS